MLSIITPAFNPNVKWFEELSQSIVKLSNLIEVEWLICFDQPEIPDLDYPEFTQLLSLYRNTGIPEIARNKALGQATGHVVMSIDVDDVLNPDNVAIMYKEFLNNSDIGWIVGRSDDYINGQVFERSLPLIGFTKKGSLYDYWIANEKRLPIHPLCFMVRRNLWIEQNGWAALETLGDIAAVINYSERHDGFIMYEQTLLYRNYQSSLSKSDIYNTENKTLPRELIIEMVNSLRNSSN